METPVDVFLYGLFMDVDDLRANGLQPTNARRASVEGMALWLGERATLTPRTDSCVHGMVMTLKRYELESLYAEPSVAAYRPEQVIVKLDDGSSLNAVCFNLPTLPETMRPNPEYAAKLQRTARKIGLPEDYIVSIGQNPDSC